MEFSIKDFCSKCDQIIITQYLEIVNTVKNIPISVAIDYGMELQEKILAWSCKWMILLFARDSCN